MTFTTKAGLLLYFSQGLPSTVVVLVVVEAAVLLLGLLLSGAVLLVLQCAEKATTSTRSQLTPSPEGRRCCWEIGGGEGLSHLTTLFVFQHFCARD